MLTRSGDRPLSPEALFANLAHSSGIVLAVSGGPDSMALLDLADLWRRATGVPVTVATVDHGLRDSSRAEAEAVGALCQERGLPHAILAWSGDKPATGLPAAAREARYALLAAHARSLGADTIVTAHQADDQAETVLMRLLRGSGPAGLAGMTSLAPLPGHPDLTLARPLLALPKADLVAWCRARGVPFFEDPTNADETYRRPQIRRLAAQLEEQGFSRPEILRLAARAGRAEATLTVLIGEKLAALPARRAPGLFELDASELAGLPEEALVRLVASEVARIAPGAAPRLERVETVAARLRTGEPFAATLGGVAIRLDTRILRLRPQPPRKFRKSEG